MSAPLVRRELRGRPGRVLMVFLTVTVAVAFTTGAFGFSEQLSRVLTPAEAVGAALPQGSVVITAPAQGLATVTALDDQLLDRVRSVPGVASAEGSYDQPVAFRLPPSAQPERPKLLRGVVLSSTFDPTRWRLLRGRAPSGPDEIVLDGPGLAVAGVALGDRARLQVPVGTIDPVVVGLVGPAGAVAAPATDAAAPGAAQPGSSGPSVALAAAHVVFDPLVAPYLLDAVGRVDRITVIPLPRTSAEALVGLLRAALPAGIRLDAVTSRIAVTQQTVGTIEDGVRLATLVYAGVTLLVSVLVVFNVLGVVVAQRTRELGLLRVVGARRATLARVVITEAVVVGLSASVVGGVLGVLLAFLGARVVSVAGMQVSFAATGSMAVVAVVVGLLVTVLGSAWPALRASRVAPLDALSDTRGGADRVTRAPLPVMAVLVGFGTAAWAANGAVGSETPAVAVVGPALVVGFVGLAVLSRWIVVPMAMLTGRMARWFGVAARLGVGNARRQPSRTAGAASTLMVGLALVAIVAMLGASARRGIDQQVGASGRVDLFVERQGLVRTSPRAVGAFLARGRGAIREVAEVIALDGSIVGPDGQEVPGVASTLDHAVRVADLGLDSGGPRRGRPGVMLSVGTAEQLGVRVGSRVTVRSTSGRRIAVPVVATYSSTSVFGGAVVDRATAESIGADGTFELAAIDLRPGVPLAAARRGAQRVADQFNQVEVSTPQEYVATRRDIADVVLRIIGVMLAGALGVGFMGLAGTLALSTNERRRELVMLRAVGASRHQIRMLVWIEATFIGVVAVVVGMGSGVLLGWVAAGSAPRTVVGSGGALVPWAQLLVVAAGAVVLAWLVSLGVAAGAARVPPSDAGRM